MGMKDQFQDKADRMQQQGKQRAEQARDQFQNRDRRRDEDEMDPASRRRESEHQNPSSRRRDEDERLQDSFDA
ncbi:MULTISPECIES: hypothetical protein [Streptomyces]|uniref:Uncharacterized protein n=1 Tax=Streptomyces hyderabadensis TaxID=598549 RepID=A0ABP9I9Z3_9ACTN|nr:hypothetical protein [Streptomyces hyderabadensis]